MLVTHNTVERFIWWVLVVAAALLVKGIYSGASEQDLQWMLEPLAAMTQFFTGMEFNLNTAGEWVNTQNNIAIVKSCAGLNFMVLSLLAAGMRFEPKIKLSWYWGKTFVVNILLCVLIAWGMTLAVNTVRILLSIFLFRYEITFLGFSIEQVHRLAGILIYFPALWLQLVLFSRLNTVRAGYFSAILYLGLVIVVPLLTGNYKINPDLFAEHAYFTFGTLLFICSICLFIRELLNRHIKKII